MSNRLNAEQYKKPTMLEDVMNKDLAGYCKKLMEATGCDVKHATKWCADRFDPKGKLNVSKHDTGLKLVDENAPWEKPKSFMLSDGMIFRFSPDDAIEVLELQKQELLDAETPEEVAVAVACSMQLNPFIERMAGREAYMIWRMCHMSEGDESVLIHGMAVKTESGLDEGSQYANGRPLSVNAALFTDLIVNGVFEYFGDAVL